MYNPFYLIERSPIQSTLGDARLRNAQISFYKKNGRVRTCRCSFHGEVTILAKPMPWLDTADVVLSAGICVQACAC